MHDFHTQTRPSYSEDVPEYQKIFYSAFTVLIKFQSIGIQKSQLLVPVTLTLTQ